MKTNTRRSKIKGIRRHGFRARMATVGGRKVLSRQRRRSSGKGKNKNS